MAPQVFLWEVLPRQAICVALPCAQFAEVGESTPCSFRSLDNKPGAYDLVVVSRLWDLGLGFRVSSSCLMSPYTMYHTWKVWFFMGVAGLVRNIFFVVSSYTREL